MPETITAPQPDVISPESSVSDILAHSPDAIQDAKTAESSTDNKQEEVSSETPSSKEVKTEETNSNEQVIDDGKPIPYSRFKQVNEKTKQLTKELEELRSTQEQLNEIMQDPDIYASIRKKQGVKDDQIKSELEAIGHKVEEPTPEFDFNTTDGWQGFIRNEIKQALNPVQQTLQQSQKKEAEKNLMARLVSEKAEAEKLCKDVYGIEYGDESDAKDPNTGAGKVFLYLDAHPEKIELVANGKISKSELLHLAMAKEGVKLGEQKGENKEKERQHKLKLAAMEGSETVKADDFPNPDWSVQKILEWTKTHPNYKLHSEM